MSGSQTEITMDPMNLYRFPLQAIVQLGIWAQEDVAEEGPEEGEHFGCSFRAGFKYVQIIG